MSVGAQDDKDSLLASTDTQDGLFNAYVAAIAAVAGYTIAKSDFDRDGVDVQFRAGGSMRPSLDAQLKATINLGDPTGEVFRFPLKSRNYDLLIHPTMVPRILIVFDMPREPEEWVTCDVNSLIMRKSAYWAHLRGLPTSPNVHTVTVDVPIVNRFDVEGLKALMARARTGSF